MKSPRLVERGPSCHKDRGRSGVEGGSLSSQWLRDAFGAINEAEYILELRGRLIVPGKSPCQ